MWPAGGGRGGRGGRAVVPPKCSYLAYLFRVRLTRRRLIPGSSARQTGRERRYPGFQEQVLPIFSAD